MVSIEKWGRWRWVSFSGFLLLGWLTSRISSLYNYPLAQKFFAFIVNRLLFVLIIFGANICSVELPDISWIDFGKWATFQKRKWFSFKRCHQAPISKWVCHWHSFIKKCKDIVFNNRFGRFGDFFGFLSDSKQRQKKRENSSQYFLTIFWKKSKKSKKYFGHF